MAGPGGTDIMGLLKYFLLDLGKQAADLTDLTFSVESLFLLSIDQRMLTMVKETIIKYPNQYYLTVKAT